MEYSSSYVPSSTVRKTYTLDSLGPETTRMSSPAKTYTLDSVGGAKGGSVTPGKTYTLDSVGGVKGGSLTPGKTYTLGSTKTGLSPTTYSSVPVTMDKNLSGGKVYTLDQVGPTLDPTREAHVVKETEKVPVVREKKIRRGLNLWLMLIVLGIIVGVILYFTHPSIVLSRNAQTNELYIDWGKLVLWAIGISIMAVLLLWIFKGLIGFNVTW